ncbi:MAG: isoprenylcysteine carboxylmethyltransferase family protein [Bacteroidota bacterium]
MNRSGYLHVLLQFVGAGITCLAAATAQTPWGPLPLIIIALGAVIGLYTITHNRIGNFNVAPPLKTHAQLITSGPYKWVRHPMYLSVIVVLVGLSLHAGTIPAWVGALVSSHAMYQKTVIEEQLLLERFPEYAAYRTSTKRMLPFIF